MLTFTEESQLLTFNEEGQLLTFTDELDANFQRRGSVANFH